MTIREICEHEARGMATRHRLGYDQHDDHLWRWLNYHLSRWSAARPWRIV
jgi:hypothetical protein